MEDAMSDEVSADEARVLLAEMEHMDRGHWLAARLARTVITLHRELAVLRAQLGPLCAVHDALVAAAALPGAGASGEAMVAAVRAKASADAREDLARIGRLVGCDSLVGVEIHAAVEHELLERDAARDAAERAERERDDALAEVETMRAEAALLREQLTETRAVVDAAMTFSDTQGVLLRYAGGEVYALPTAEPHVWRVAGIEVHVGVVAAHDAEVIGLETTAGLAESAERRRRMAAEVAPKATSKAKSKRRVAARGSRG
jgi:hypothetical protein